MNVVFVSKAELAYCLGWERRLAPIVHNHFVGLLVQKTYALDLVISVCDHAYYANLTLNKEYFCLLLFTLLPFKHLN